MKTPKQFAEWVDGIRRQYDLYEMRFGRVPASAGETLNWIHQEWRVFTVEVRFPTPTRYCHQHRLYEEFHEWLEAKIMLKGAIKA
jgi:hypothetical protein